MLPAEAGEAPLMNTRFLVRLISLLVVVEVPSESHSYCVESSNSLPEVLRLETDAAPDNIPPTVALPLLLPPVVLPLPPRVIPKEVVRDLFLPILCVPDFAVFPSFSRRSV